MRFPSPVFSSVIFLCVLVAAELGCGGGSASLQKNSSNPGQPQVPSISFSAQPSTVSSGASATLSWTSSNATAVTITGLGTFSASGSVQVTPAATTTYSAVASGPAGSTDTSVTVSVTGSPSPGPGPSPGPTPQPPPTSGVPAFSHVFVVVEENHGYSSVLGSSSMLYFNSLASRYAVATQYYADTHPSIGNYFMLTTGQAITNNDSFTGTVSADNIVRHLLTAGKTWKSYAESLPKIGYTGGDSYPYAK